MNKLVACIIIANRRRETLIRERVVPSVAAQDFDEIVLVGDWADGAIPLPPNVRYLRVEPLLHNTIDALIKRDVGTLATRADTLVYLNDDHALAPHFLTELRDVLNEPWDVLVPNRCTLLPGTTAEYVALNNGEHEAYCGGHAGVFRRRVITQRPWTAQRHNRLWDYYASLQQRVEGAEFAWQPRAELAIIDLIPEASPWK